MSGSVVPRLGLNAWLGIAITTFVAATALVSLVWTPYDVLQLDLTNRFSAPSFTHWFGTDHYGRDMASMIMEGSRNSMTVATVAVGIGLGIGVPLGLAAATGGGWLDELLMRGNDIAFAFPALVTAIVITALLGPGAANAMIAIGVFNVPVFARLARSGAVALWQRDYVQAARACGKGPWLISWQHIVPNIANLLVVQATIALALAVIQEAGLAYLGLGTQPPYPSWGKMLNEAQTMIGIAPHTALVPGLAIVVTVIGLNLLGDGLRDRLDPRRIGFR